MGVALTKDSIDLGIVVSDADRALGFYRDLLGLELVGETPMPGPARMYRLMCGTTMLKLWHYETPRTASAPPGGIPGATGYRYFTMSVSNLGEMAAACEAAGCTIAMPITELRPGVTILIVEDPDGNWVEFLQAG
ncbi:MAG: VOC family protein [Ilumatobacteraceae bacterium]